MNFIAWNVRGLNDPLKQRAIVDRVRSLKSSLVCLIETRVKENKKQPIVDKLFNGWSMLNNYSSAYNGRIWILWNQLLHVDLLTSTDPCITCTISYDSKQMVISAVYGSNDGMDRRNLWNQLCIMSGSMSQKP